MALHTQENADTWMAAAAAAAPQYERPAKPTCLGHSPREGGREGYVFCCDESQRENTVHAQVICLFQWECGQRTL